VYRTLQNIWSQDRCTHLFTLSGLRCVRVLSHLCCVRLFATLWTIALQAPLSKEFSRQDTRAGCHALLQGIFPTQESNLCLLCLLDQGRKTYFLVSQCGKDIFFFSFSEITGKFLTEMILGEKKEKNPGGGALFQIFLNFHTTNSGINHMNITNLFSVTKHRTIF